jgi:GT2 family glycosyltransferase
MITLCICTWSRCQSLRQTLNSILRLDGLDRLTEILIVDNNSTDATPEVVDQFRSELPIRRVVETSQGLSHARNRAISEFKGEVLLFTDDDVRFDCNWLSAYANAITKFPEAQFFGGRILPRWDENPPAWFKGEKIALIDGVLVWYDHGCENRPYAKSEEPPFGASFAVRRALLERMSLFRPDLGCKGSSRGRGEETEFLERCISAGVSGVYVGEALCWHCVDSSRLKLAALFRHGIEKGKSHHAIDGGEPGSFVRVPMHLARGLNQLLRGRGDRFRQCVINAGIEVGKRRAKSAIR